MREILFRGKRIYDSLFSGKWVFGSYIKSPTFNEERGDWHLIGVYEDCLIVPVDKDTVSEFTGLRDKNGNRIFEGDIIKVSLISGGERIHAIGIGECYDTEGETVYGVWVDYEGCKVIIPNSAEYLKHYEVIGNKWDNPELLENKQCRQ